MKLHLLHLGSKKDHDVFGKERIFDVDAIDDSDDWPLYLYFDLFCVS